MTDRSITSVYDLTGKQKAALLVISLGQQASVKLLRLLTEEEIEEITLEIANFKKVDPAMQDEILREFYNLALAQEYILQGGVDYARSVLRDAVGEEKAGEIIGRLSSFLRVTPFDFLKKTDAKQLLTFIANEHPQTIALILCYLDPEDAAPVVGGLPPEVQVDVARRIANMDRTSPEVIREVERVIEQKVSAVMTTEVTQSGGVKNLVEVLNLVDRATEKAIMENLEDSDPELADEIKRLMFVFEDIKLLDDRSVQAVLGQTDKKDLAMAIKGVAEDVRDKVMRNMSKRAAASLQEEMDFMGPVRLKDVEDAQQRIVNVIRRLEESGEIIIERGGGQYV
ncbi:flagellar motor switch protein FliG [bacterium]|nr:flagellar motor switch protein FliG [bacterium]